MKSPLSRQRRAALRLQYLRELQSFEKPLGRKIAKIIASQGKALALWYSRGHTPDLALLTAHRPAFEALLRNYYRRVMATFAAKLVRSLKQSIFDDAFNAWLNTSARSTVDDADSTTIEIVKNAISRGIDQGLSVDEIVAYIRTVTAADNAISRAMVIARTEMHDAMNFAQVEAAKSTGLPLVKIWTAANDGRTREAHAEADGQTVLLDDSFIVDGEDVERPGDGSAGNAINCRCTLVFTRAPTSD